MRAGEDNVHHAGAGAAGEINFHRRRHDLGFGLAGRIVIDQCAEAFHHDIHAFADLCQLFGALDGARHIEFEIERDEFQRRRGQLAVIAHRHDEIHPVNADALPASIERALAQPLAWHFGPDVVADPGLGFVADPTRFGGKDDRQVALERQQDIGVAMDDQEAREVGDRALEARVLAAADERGVEAVALERRPDILVAPLDLALRHSHDRSSRKHRSRRDDK